MYEAPIKLIQRQLRINEENGILKAIKDVGVVVDEEELAKALQYDRGQYDKGYSDGIKEFVKKLKRKSFVLCEFGEKIDVVDVIDIEIIAEKMTEGGGSDA